MSGEALLVALLAMLGLLVGVSALAIFRHRPHSPATSLLDRGELTAVLDQADTGPGAERDELYAAAVAAKHLLLLDRAAELLALLLATDPADGEAHLEYGLVAAYAGRYAVAAHHLRAAATTRADLGEFLTLHLAWLALAQGDAARARRLFEGVAEPLETKLRRDIGPGEPMAAEWFLQAADLWRALGDEPRASWAAAEGLAAAPESRLGERVGRLGAKLSA